MKFLERDLLLKRSNATLQPHTMRVCRVWKSFKTRLSQKKLE